MTCVSLTFVCMVASLMSRSVSENPEYWTRSLKTLKSYLHTRLDPKVPPVSPQTRAVDASITLGPVQVHDLDDATQILTLGFYITLSWTDASLVWNTSDYSGLDLVEFAQQDQWTPSVILANRASGDGHLTTTMPVTLTYDGGLNWQKAVILSVLCKTDLTKYPFDSQICPVSFASGLGYTVNLEPLVNVDREGLNLQTNGEWETVGMTSAKQTYEAVYHQATFYIHLSRKYFFHVLNLVFPMCLVSALNSFVFLLPASSGEKMGFLMTVFVSNALFLSLIHNSTPSTSDSVSKLSMFLVMIQTQGFLAIAATILVLNVYHRRQNVQVNGALQGCTPQDDSDLVACGQHHAETGIQGKDRKVPLDRLLDYIFFACFTCFCIGNLQALLYM